MPDFGIGGFSGSIRWFRDPLDIARDALSAGLHDAADFLLDKANLTIPHQEGTMQDSGATTVGMDTISRMPWAAVYYGGAASAYVVAQHEHPEWHHPPFDGKPRRGKWLELTAQEEAGNLERVVWQGASGAALR